jgi:hypothetical protein
MKKETSKLPQNEAMQYKPVLAPVYQSIHTTCECGKKAELKWTGQWYENKCQCGTKIRMNRDKSKMIVEGTF